jgi:hypothetical protein
MKEYKKINQGWTSRKGEGALPIGKEDDEL